MTGKQRKSMRPSYNDDGFSDDEFTNSILTKRDEQDDSLESMTFGALNSAQNELLGKKKKKKSIQTESKKRKYSESESEEDSEDSEEESDSDSDAPPQENSSRGKTSRFQKNGEKKKRSKHAPAETSSKKPVSRIREIPGLKSSKESTLYTDIRFDPAYGKADLRKTRKDYAFLDEYRQLEVKSMETMLKDKKSGQMLSNRDREEIQLQLQSLKSRLDTMKNRDLEEKILADHKRNQIKGFKDGQQNNPYFLKRSDKRKLIQKAKFDSMKASQREKVMERKRKKRLGKEFRQLEFNQPRH